MRSINNQQSNQKSQNIERKHITNLGGNMSKNSVQLPSTDTFAIDARKQRD